MTSYFWFASVHAFVVGLAATEAAAAAGTEREGRGGAAGFSPAQRATTGPCPRRPVSLEGARGTRGSQGRCSPGSGPEPPAAVSPGHRPGGRGQRPRAAVPPPLRTPFLGCPFRGPPRGKRRHGCRGVGASSQTLPRAHRLQVHAPPSCAPCVSPPTHPLPAPASGKGLRGARSRGPLDCLHWVGVPVSEGNCESGSTPQVKPS